MSDIVLVTKSRESRKRGCVTIIRKGCGNLMLRIEVENEKNIRNTIEKNNQNKKVARIKSRVKRKRVVVRNVAKVAQNFA